MVPLVLGKPRFLFLPAIVWYEDANQDDEVTLMVMMTRMMAIVVMVIIVLESRFKISRK